MRKTGNDMQIGFKPWAAAVRTQPLYMGHMLFQLRYLGTPVSVHLVFFLFFLRGGDDMQRRATGQTRTLSKSCVYVTHTLPTELTANLVKNVFGNQRQKAKYPLTNLSRWVLCWRTCQIVTLCDGSRPVLHSQSVSIWRVVSETHKTTYLTNSTCKEGTFVEI